MMGGNRQWIPLKLNASGVITDYLYSNYHVYTCNWLIYLVRHTVILALLMLWFCFDLVLALMLYSFLQPYWVNG
jgi:hypothetical protein